jgi:hypothetical protein
MDSLAKFFSQENALQEIAIRYFRSRSPATLKDFIWWSGLNVSEAKTALDLANNSLTKENINGEIYYFFRSKNFAALKDLQSLNKKVFLLAGFDEYLIGYADRSACLDEKFLSKAVYSNGIFHPTIVIDGQIIGKWRPITKGKNITMRSELFMKLSKQQIQLIEREFEKYCDFANHKLPKM